MSPKQLRNEVKAWANKYCFSVTASEIDELAWYLFMLRVRKMWVGEALDGK